MKTLSIVKCFRDKQLFGKIFAGDSWDNWEVFLRATFALPLSISQMNVFKSATGRDDLPATPAREAFMLVGRRGGKSRIASFIGTWIAALSGVERFLSPGEPGVVLLLAQDRAAARVLFSYVRSYFREIPMLAAMVVNETQNAIELNNGCVIEIGTSDFRGIRGKTLVACLCDEICFWPTGVDAASSDEEVLVAARPAMASIPTALLLALSTPYSRRGSAYRAWKASFGVKGADTLVWVADTRTMNKKISRLTITAAMLKDPAAARSEYFAEWRRDISSFLSEELIDNCTRSYASLAPLPGTRYHAFVDPSGGAQDSFTVAVAHYERAVAVIDLVHEVEAPFSPASATAQIVSLLRTYRVSEVVGDKYGGEFPRELFAKHGVSYKPSERSRSEYYLEFLPALTASCCELPSHAKLRSQLLGLERKTGRNQDVVDHVPGSHDDVSNVVAGCVVEVLRESGEGGVYGLFEYEKGVAKGELPDPFAQPSLQERLAARQAEVERQCVDPLAKYNLPPQTNAAFVARTRECSCGGAMTNEASDRFMFTCAACERRVSINTDYAVNPGPNRKQILAQMDDRWSRGVRAFGRFGRR